MAISNDELAIRKGISVEQVKLLRQSRGATNETLAGLSEPAIRRALRRLNYPDMPRARQAFRALQSKDDHGRIPAHALAKAVRRKYTLRTKVQQLEVAGIPVQVNAPLPAGMGLGVAASAGLALHRWEWLGPGNIGGRTRSLIIHPEGHAEMWAGSVAGGIWHTVNAGASWDPVDDFMGNLAVSCMVMDPNDHKTLYAGTGEGFSNADALRGAGIFRTVDGVKWSVLASTTTQDFAIINRLAISPDSETLLAATPGGMFRSANPGRTSWTKVLDSQIADVRFHPAQSTHAVAGGLENGEAYFTRDGGKTWQISSHSPWSGRVELTYATADPNTVYASVQMTNGEIWCSQDGGATYQRRQAADANGNPAPYLGDQGWYDNTIWAGDPTNVNLVIVGGINLWRSSDGGNSLAEISTWWDRSSVHADQHVIVSHPAYDGVSNKSVFFANDGGVYVAEDVLAVGAEPEPPFTEGWTELVNNYGVTQFYGAAGNTTSGKIVGGTQDNGTLCFDPAAGTEGWLEIFGGDGGWCAADPADPNVFYGEYVHLNIHRNMDGGTSNDTMGDRYISGEFWNAAIGESAWKPVPFRIPDAMNRSALFIAPFVIDPNEPNRLLAGGLSLWRTNDAKAPNTPASGPRWSSIKPSAGSAISALAILRGNSNVVWVGHQDGKVFRTLNGIAATPIWQRMDQTGPNPLHANRYCTCITLDPQNPAHAYVAFGGYVSENIWVTRDGATWNNIGADLPAAPIRAIALHPANPNFVYVGTEVGLFASEDGGSTWSPTTEGPNNCSIDDMFWMDQTLVCATHGRGVFRIDLSII